LPAAGLPAAGLPATGLPATGLPAEGPLFTSNVWCLRNHPDRDTAPPPQPNSQLDNNLETATFKTSKVLNNPPTHRRARTGKGCRHQPILSCWPGRTGGTLRSVIWRAHRGREIGHHAISLLAHRRPEIRVGPRSVRRPPLGLPAVRPQACPPRPQVRPAAACPGPGRCSRLVPAAATALARGPGGPWGAGSCPRREAGVLAAPGPLAGPETAC